MNYSNTIVSGMLSWLRGIANWAINLFNLSGERSLSLLNWFSEHWVGMLITLIVLGLVIDWLVWIIRWRPYWVWFRRKRILIDDTDTPTRRYSRDAEWEDEDDGRRRRTGKNPGRRRTEPDFFSVDPSTAYEAEFASEDTVDEDSFRPKRHADMAEDPFTISTDDPDAINFWQEDVFNVSDLQEERRKPRAKHS